MRTHGSTLIASGYARSDVGKVHLNMSHSAGFVQLVFVPALEGPRHEFKIALGLRAGYSVRQKFKEGRSSPDIRNWSRVRGQAKSPVDLKASFARRVGLPKITLDLLVGASCCSMWMIQSVMLGRTCWAEEATNERTDDPLSRPSCFRARTRDRRQSQQPHQVLHPLPVDAMALGRQPCRHPARSIIGPGQIMPIDQRHNRKFLRADRGRRAVH
jgi:hypothetical protein